MGPKTFFQNWTKWTLSFIAVRNIRKQGMSPFKMIWWSIILATTAAFFVHSGFLIAEYTKFKSSANLKIFYLSRIPFPAVTVCSINPFKQTKIGSSAELTQFMEAYNFILDQRQKLLKNNSTTPSNSSQQLYQSDSMSGQGLLSRKKRQTCSTVTQQNQYNTSFFYTEQACNNKTVLNLQCMDNSSIINFNLSYTLTTQTRKILDASFYYCLEQYLCGSQNACAIYSDTMSLLKSVNSCLTTQGLIADLQYPPDYWTGNPANDMCRRMGALCAYPLPYYTYAYFEKPPNDYAGTYSYSGYNHINATIDNCDRSGTYYVTAQIPSNCSTNNYINIITTLVDCMSNYSCGKACVYSDCPYTETPMDSCGNEAYYDTMCAIAVCNATSSTQWTTSTELSTTTEEPTTSTESTSMSSSTSTSTSTTSTTPETTTESTSTTSTSTSTSSTTTSVTDSTTSSTSSSTSTDSSTSTSTSSSTSTSTSSFTDTSTSSSTSTPTSTSTPETSTTTLLTTSSSTSTPTTTALTSTLAETSPSNLVSTQSSTLTTSGNTASSSSSPPLATTVTLSSSSSTTSLTTVMTAKQTTTLSQQTPQGPNDEATTVPDEDQSSETQQPESTTQSQQSTTANQSSTSPPLSTLTPISTSPGQTSPQTPVTSSQTLSTSNQSSSQTGPNQQSTTPIGSQNTSQTNAQQTTSVAIFSTTPFSQTSTNPTGFSSSIQSTVSSGLSLSTVSTVLSSSQSSAGTTAMTSNNASALTPIYTPTNTGQWSTSSTTPSDYTGPTPRSTQGNLSTTTALTVSQQTGTTTCCNQSGGSTPFSNTTGSTAISPTTTTVLVKSTPISQTITSSLSNATMPSTFATTSRSLTLREIANLWGLSEFQNQPSFISHVREALIEIAASLTPEERAELCYSLPELVSSCNIGEQPCDMDNDFAQVFDVNYGYCYTFNPQLPTGVHDTTMSGPNNGLRMVLFTNPITYLNSTESKGFKVAIHSQDYSPFPNTEGYFGDVGRSIEFILEQDRYTRLGQPYSNCDTSETLQERRQPFFFNGSYSIEGCFRSCFQQKVVDACHCADPRFPYTEPGMFCIQTNATNYQCNQNYIATYGDYYFVNCTCYNPCNETDYTAELWKAKWPSGSFFYEQYCPSAELSNLNCEEYYRNNSAEIYVYYSRLTYSTLDQAATTEFVELIGDIGGGSGLWIGCTAITLGELLLLLIQSLLWILCCSYELPEVPSCRRNDYSIDESRGRGTWSGDDPSGLKHDPHPALPVRNSVSDMSQAWSEDDIIPEFQLMFKQMVPVRGGDHAPPTPIPSTPSPVPPLYGD